MVTTFRLFVATLASAMLMVGCSKSSSGGGGATSDMVISGTLSVAQTSMSVASKLGTRGDVGSFAATSVNDLEIYAIAFTMPPAIASASLDANGNFSVTLPGAKGSTVTAIFRDKTDQSQVGTVVFVDSDKKDLNGNASESSSIVLNDSVQLGSITLSNDGKVKIPVSQVQTVIGSTESVAAGTAFDPTGTWYMKAFDGQVPTGYMTVGACQAQQMGGGGDGPCIGFPLTLLRFAGKDFTPNASCQSESNCPANAGTDGGDRFALSIWGGDASMGVGACGYKSGFTGDEARYHARINIASGPTVGNNQIALDHYVYNMPVGFCGTTGHSCSSPFDKSWMWDGATSSRDVHDCRPMKVASQYDAWACLANERDQSGTTGTKVWNVGIQGGGCFNSATGKPVNVMNWGPNVRGECTGSDVSSVYGAGYRSNNCTYTAFDHDKDVNTPAIDVVCKHIGGQFNDNSGNPGSAYTYVDGKWVGEPATLLASGKKCDFSEVGGAGTDAKKLAGYRCFAEAYWTNLKNATETGCMREFNFDWSATSLANFARDDQRGKPKNAFLTNILKYTPDGQMATLEDEERHKITVNTGASNSTFCEVSRRTVISFKKISESRVLVDLKQGGQMNSTDAACLAVAKAAKEGKTIDGASNLQEELSPMNMIFYADKTP